MEVAVKGRAKRKHLNAQDCGELGTSADGTDALTKPNVSQRSQDPNKGLYPRTPTKRGRKATSVSGSPSVKQKAINDFFFVKKVLSSSPHKSPMPSTSTGTGVVDEEEEEDDDVSLLAAPVVYEPDAEEEDGIDDNSLLAAEMFSETEKICSTDARLVDVGLRREKKEAREADYLEGLTAEMFGDDEDFEEFEEEEEVEALPDAHFGLLGCSNDLLQPRGCIGNLPEEVLREVLCYVPASDLYRNVSLVCHCWRNIVLDPKFVPFKKQYFRYMMGEKETVLEITSTLENSLITGPAPADHCIRNLVVLMAQHTVGERVKPEDVLARVRKHRLFPQAEASVKSRIPDIQRFLHLDIEGPNPFAAMAVILLLSEGVGDVQALVSLLPGCMSLTAVIEYLSHVATMFLALERNKIKISYRLHYNIYYVLHLLENGPFNVNSGQDGLAQIQLTREQQEILCHDIQKDHVVKIVAFAGTGKTTTLVEYAARRPHLRFLYVAFNNSVACEARRRFPTNVDCKTAHSLAYNDIGRRYNDHKKLTFNVKPFLINFVLPSGAAGYARAKVVATILNAFMASANQTVGAQHVPYDYAVGRGRRQVIRPDEETFFITEAKRIWNKMQDVKEKSQQAYYMPHDGYLKLWQLRNPKPDLSEQYDAIFIDEAQDCTPAIIDVLLSQRCGKILVGDPHQQIYTFKGAVNALRSVCHTHIFYLTQSFRFGSEIAFVGAAILKVCKRVQKILVGGMQKGGVCYETAEIALDAMKKGVSQSPGKIAILSRCNLGVFKSAVQLMEANQNCRIHFVGGVKNIGLEKIMDIYHLISGAGQEAKRKAVKDSLIRTFFLSKKNPYVAFKEYIIQTEDRELEGKLIIVETYRDRIPELVARLEVSSETDLHRADFIVGTVHKAKGLEFDTVIVSDDFANVPASRHNLCRIQDFSFSKIPEDEWNLLYVAVTRAMTSLVVTKNILRILTVAGEYFLKSQMPGSLAEGISSPPCSISECPNCVTPGSAFVMSRQIMHCSERVLNGGPLCERCVWTRIGPTAFLMTDDIQSMAEIPQGLQNPVHPQFFLELFF